MVASSPQSRQQQRRDLLPHALHPRVLRLAHGGPHRVLQGVDFDRRALDLRSQAQQRAHGYESPIHDFRVRLRGEDDAQGIEERDGALEVFGRGRGGGGEEDGVVYVQGGDSDKEIAVVCLPVRENIAGEVLDLVEFLQCERATLGGFEEVSEGTDGHHDVVLRRGCGLSYAGDEKVNDVAAAGVDVCCGLWRYGEEA